jgi:hypothetical protein
VSISFLACRFACIAYPASVQFVPFFSLPCLFKEHFDSPQKLVFKSYRFSMVVGSFCSAGCFVFIPLIVTFFGLVSRAHYNVHPIV